MSEQTIQAEQPAGETTVRQAKKAARAEKRALRQEKAAKGWLNRCFHHIDRGSSLGNEISAGILMCILGVCGIFMNMQLLSRYIMDPSVATAAEMGESYALFYFQAMLVAFLGSLLMGCIARLPLVQISGLGMSVVLVSALGLGNGLSYANLLAVCFVSSGVFTLLAALPRVCSAVVNAVPASVRRAMPVAVGLLLAYVAIQLTGLVSFSASNMTVQGVGTVLNTSRLLKVDPTAKISGYVQTGALFDFPAYNGAAYKGDSYYPLVQICLIAVVVTFAAYCLLRDTKRPVLYALLIGTGVYFIGYLTKVVFYFTKNGALQFELDSLWARLWMVGSEDAMHLHLPTVLANLNPGKLLKEGFSFSAYAGAGGSDGKLMLTGILTNLALLLGYGDAAMENIPAQDAKAEGRALLCCGLTNLAAPVLGQPPVAISPVSVSGKRDGAKSGIAAITAAIGFLLNAFVWIVPFLFATTTSYDIQFNQYGHYGVVLAMLTENSFLVADAILVLTGLVMAAGFIRNPEQDMVPFLATVAATLALSNPAMGMSVGIIAHVLVNVFRRERNLTIGNGVAALTALALVVITVIT